MHSNKTTYNRTEDENDKLCVNFAIFFADKISNLKLAVSGRTTSVPCPADPLHVGPLLDILAPVTATEVVRILSSLPPSRLL